MKAVILADRQGVGGAGGPDGPCWLETQIAAFIDAGVREIGVVTGRDADAAETVLRGAGAPGVRIESVFNPFHAVSGGLASAWAARGFMEEDCVLSEGGGAFEAAIVKRMLEPTDAAIALAADPDAPATDWVRIQLQNGRAMAVGGRLDPDRADAGAVGLARFSGSGRRVFDRTVNEMLRRPDGLQASLWRAFDELARSGLVSACLISGLKWDAPEDLSAAA